MENDLKLEDIMEKLGNTVAKLESEELSLEDSYAAFSQGMELVMKGNQAIDRVEKQMKVLMENESETGKLQG
jgi:exodeoxyribonuclease VII small subunit